jgi:hypothetical protein
MWVDEAPTENCVAHAFSIGLQAQDGGWEAWPACMLTALHLLNGHAEVLSVRRAHFALHGVYRWRVECVGVGVTLMSTCRKTE